MILILNVYNIKSHYILDFAYIHVAVMHKEMEKVTTNNQRGSVYDEFGLVWYTHSTYSADSVNYIKTDVFRALPESPDKLRLAHSVINPR